MAEHLGERDRPARRQGMVPGRHQHEPVLPEREGLQRAGIHRAGQDPEVGRPLGHQPDDLLGGALVDLDADPGVIGQEGRGASGRNSVSALVLASTRIWPKALPEKAAISSRRRSTPARTSRAWTRSARPAGRADALPAPGQQGGPEGFLHQPDPRRGGRQGEVRPRGPVGDGAGLDHVPEQAEIDEIEPHHREGASRRAVRPARSGPIRAARDPSGSASPSGAARPRQPRRPGAAPRPPRRSRLQTRRSFRCPGPDEDGAPRVDRRGLTRLRQTKTGIHGHNDRE